MILLYIACADFSVQNSEFQMRCVERLLRVEGRPKADVILKFKGILPNDFAVTDICEYRCIHCFDHKVVETFVWQVPASGPDYQLSLIMQWMPPTTKHVHLISCFLVDGLVTSGLPRQLKYLFLQGCLRTMNSSIGAVDFNALPHAMQEIHLIQCSLLGHIDIFNLPQSLERLTVSGALVDRLLVDMRALPRTFISVSSRNERFKARAVNGKFDETVRCNAVVKGDYETRQYLILKDFLEKAMRAAFFE